MFGIAFKSSSINSLLRDRLAARDVASRYQHERSQGFHSTRPPPPNVSRHHKRSLTNQNGSEDSQNASLLLQSLPLEIRQQVWKACLGGRTIHLRLGQSRQIHAIICLSLHPEFCDEYEVNYGGQYGCSRYGSYENGLPMGQLLSLLLSCKQIYSEAIEYLYRYNTFVTAEQDVVQYLSRLIPSRRLDIIHKFRFAWQYPGGPPSIPQESDENIEMIEYKLRVWQEIWGNFASMRGLKELRIKFFVKGEEWENIEKEKAVALLGPVMNIKGINTFEWVLPFRCLSDAELWDALPCSIRRAENIGELIGEGQQGGE